MGKLRKSYSRDFPESCLRIHERLALSNTRTVHFSGCIKTMGDAEAAWEQNRHIFLNGGFSKFDAPKPGDLFERYNPAQRPWPFWILDKGYAEIPANQVAALQQLRELQPGEFEAAQKLAGKNAGHYTKAELVTLKQTIQ